MSTVVTGTEAPSDDEAAPPSPFASLDRPVVVWVCDPTVGCDGFDKLEEVVFKAEKVGLAMKAFRAVKMAPSDVDADPILQGAGKAVPRLLVVDPSREKVKALEKPSAGGLFAEMKRVADRWYAARLDRVVKDHLDLLTERDQLSNQLKVLDDKDARLADEDGRGAQKEREKLKEERDRVQERLQDLAAREKELWNLTRREQPA